jgi:hypothetical protein
MDDHLQGHIRPQSNSSPLALQRVGVFSLEEQGQREALPS